jgi:NAD-dependent deacetylase
VRRSFGQSLIPEVIDRAMAVSRSCDVLLAVGSTLSVYPAASCVPLAAAAGAKVAIINAGPTELDELAGVVLRGSISELLPAVVAASRAVLS